jgi:CheY-like chemotaxis protein
MFSAGKRPGREIPIAKKNSAFLFYLSNNSRKYYFITGIRGSRRRLLGDVAVVVSRMTFTKLDCGRGMGMTQDDPAKRPNDSERRTDSGQFGAASPEMTGDGTPRRKTILIVDDVAVMRLRLRPQLEEAGYRVLEAEDGEKALELIRMEPLIDLVITDVSMPVMDGLELIRILRTEINHAHLPVIVCTARGEISVVRKAKLLGVQGFLVKPITKPTLLSVIKRELG